jgi:hypothetical protein
MSDKKTADSLTITSNGNETETLSKEQKKFNSQLKKIHQLQAEYDLYQELLPKIRADYAANVLPAIWQYRLAEKERVFILDSIYDSCTKKDKHFLSDFICEQIEMLTGTYPDQMKDLENLYKKYSPQQSLEQVHKEHKAMSINRLMDMFAQMGVDIGDMDREELENKTEEEIIAFVQQKMLDHLEQKQQEYREDPLKGKKKTAKQVAKLEEKQTEEKSISKIIRKIYTDIVKNFHPDLEQDEAVKLTKTELMKKVTQAYEDQDLYRLLTLQLELLGKKADLFALPNAELSYYNKLLADQINTLKMSIKAITQALIEPNSPATIQPFLAYKHDYMKLIDQHKRDCVNDTNIMKKNNEALKTATKREIKEFIDDLREEKASDELMRMLAKL